MVLVRESDTSIKVTLHNQDKIVSCSLNLAEAGELAQTIISWVFKAILG